MNASFMLFQRHGWDIHAVWPGAGGAREAEAPFPVHAAAGRPGEELTAGDGPAADGVDAVADLVRGGLRERRAAAGPAQLVVDDAMRLAGAVAPRAHEAVELLAEHGQRLAAHRGLAAR